MRETGTVHEGMSEGREECGKDPEHDRTMLGEERERERDSWGMLGLNDETCP